MKPEQRDSIIIESMERGAWERNKFGEVQTLDEQRRNPPYPPNTFTWDTCVPWALNRSPLGPK